MRLTVGRLVAVLVGAVLLCCNGSFVGVDTGAIGYVLRGGRPVRVVTAHVDRCVETGGIRGGGTYCYGSWRMPDGTTYHDRLIGGATESDEGHDVKVDVVYGDDAGVDSPSRNHSDFAFWLLALALVDGTALVAAAVALGMHLSHRRPAGRRYR